MKLLHGDCREQMAAMDAASVDAIVTDPPYELGFMGKGWDKAGVAFDSATWREALRVIKPGGHMLAFGGTRTFHRMAVAIEDAGFEIRDTLCWLYGSGFPKSLDIGKAIDKAAGAEREVLATIPDRWAGKGNVLERANQAPRADAFLTAPATDIAKQWDGWGTALKPAYEPIIMARKPLIGTVAANVAAYGTGGINIDQCRIESEESTERTSGVNQGVYGSDNRRGMVRGGTLGRWPANVVLDEDAAALLDEQSGTMRARGNRTPTKRRQSEGVWAANGARPGIGQDGPIDRGDTGGASRFFYCAKASRAERNAGLDGMPERDKHVYSAGIVSADHPGTASGGGNRPAANHHPTVKPIALMQWLVRLVTPAGGTVLDPFMGSGSTGIACAREGLRFIGIEQDSEYVAIARRRIDNDAPLLRTAAD